MENLIKEKLFQRNKNLIDVILQKIENEVPGTVDLIGVFGSFQSGDFYEKSDLDLCIVINDEKAEKILTSAFIYDDIGFDIYTTCWNRFAEKLEYKNPHITRLLELDIVYHRNEKCLQKYLEFRKKAKEKLRKPLAKEDFKKAENFFKEAKVIFADLMISEKISEARYLLIQMLNKLEFSLYMLNKTFFKKGESRIPEEISQMKLKPKNFHSKYLEIISVNEIREIKSKAQELIRIFSEFLLESKRRFFPKKELLAKNIKEVYEKLYNSIHKIKQAAEINDLYLALKTATGCQKYFDYLFENFQVEKIDIMENFNPNDLFASAKALETGINQIKIAYLKLGISVNEIEKLEEYL